MTTYKIVRFYLNHSSRAVNGMSGLSLHEAQDYCNDPESSYKTCTKSHNVRRTKERGPWFNGYQEE